MISKLVEELEYLGGRLISLYEAEELAAITHPKMLPELRKLRRHAFRRVIVLARRILKGRP